MGQWDAGRRSAGLGSKGGTRAHTHAVGARAFCACLRDMRAFCVDGGHKVFDGAEVNFGKVVVVSNVIKQYQCVEDVC